MLWFPGIFAGTMITVKASDPLWYSPRRLNLLLAQFSQNISCEVDATWGYKQGSITLLDHMVDLMEWYNYGLGRHIEYIDPDGDTFFEGFVNKIRFNLGFTTLTRGPLTKIANRVQVNYTPYLDITVSPPTTGPATTTTLVGDATSQARYGIIEEAIEGGTLMDALTNTGGPASPQAENIRDTALSEKKNPDMSGDYNLGAGAPPSIQLEIAGYGEWLDLYLYTAAGPGYLTATAKLQAIISANPNATIYSSDFSGMDTNSVLEKAEEARTAKTIANEIISRGDGVNRWLFGFEADRKAYYRAIPTKTEYNIDLTSQTGLAIIRAENQVVNPWKVKPGKFAIIKGITEGILDTAGTELRDNPFVMFVESVRFDLPLGVGFSGGKVYRLEQMLTDKGLWV